MRRVGGSCDLIHLFPVGQNSASGVYRCHYARAVATRWFLVGNAYRKHELAEVKRKHHVAQAANSSVRQQQNTPKVLIDSGGPTGI
jgi:predicted fused transcriptional regulator/phosphomethylpyrimidine kinase